jgi:hypothetical protein
MQVHHRAAAHPTPAGRRPMLVRLKGRLVRQLDHLHRTALHRKGRALMAAGLRPAQIMAGVLRAGLVRRARAPLPRQPALVQAMRPLHQPRSRKWLSTRAPLTSPPAPRLPSWRRRGHPPHKRP